MKIGIIAEDDSDVAVVREITLSLLKPYCIGFKHFVSNGSGKLRRKCGVWSRNLVKQGCPWIIVIYDLDVYDEQKLRTELTNAIAPAKARDSVVLIPKREIEAWLLYDGRAIAVTFNKENNQPRLPGNPESLMNPKKHLRDLIWKNYRKRYLNTVHNARIAMNIDVSLLKKSISFAPHPVFTLAVRKMLC